MEKGKAKMLELIFFLVKGRVFASLGEELRYEAERMLGDVGHVRRVSGAAVVEMTRKDEQWKTTKQ